MRSRSRARRAAPCSPRRSAARHRARAAALGPPPSRRRAGPRAPGCPRAGARGAAGRSRPRARCSSQSAWPAASAARRLSSADAASPFMKTERRSFRAAASPALVGDDLHRHAERSERVGEGAGAQSRRRARACRARVRGRGRAARRRRSARPHPSTSAASSRFSDGASGVQVRVDRSGRECGQRRRRRFESGPRRSSALSTTSLPATVDAGSCARATPCGVEPRQRVVAAHVGARCSEVGGEPAACLAEAEHRDRGRAHRAGSDRSVSMLSRALSDMRSRRHGRRPVGRSPCAQRLNRIVDDLRNHSAVCATVASSANYDALREAIVRGDLAPNARLVESDLSTTYEMSRGAVRTALIRLEQEGLVVREPHRGARVRQVSDDEAVEILQARAVLEGLAVRLTARADRRYGRRTSAGVSRAPARAARARRPPRGIGRERRPARRPARALGARHRRSASSAP